MRKKFLLAVNAALLLFATQSANARYAAILLDADSGDVLHEVESMQSWFPASLTKMMTLYMTFEALTNGEIHLHDVLHASRHAARQPNSRLGLRTNQKITVEEAILAIVTRSANDATVVLAEHLAVTEDNFAVRMTAKAHTLGMYNTYFKNATGLPNDWQVTTARDMSLLAIKLYKNFPQYYPYFGAHSLVFKGRELNGINKFTATYEGAEGMKTGFTCNSGYNLVSSASRNGRRLIGVILGGHTSDERYHLMINQMNHGFSGDYRPIATLYNLEPNSTVLPPHQLDCANGETHEEHHEHNERRAHRRHTKMIKSKERHTHANHHR
ncbi:MAG: D-alanyl-D-alanine carboxypeptidase [Methylococcales bacterium]|nr:D-alanyl-D-alanine carboxypeptidase [Methylococcales bacterium]